MRTKSDLENLFDDGMIWPVEWDPAKWAPENLYHYTGAAGVFGILSNRSLWATNFSFLNDPSEIMYGRTLIREIIRDIEELRCDLKEIISRELETRSSEVYVCCFTKCRDDLSQWRAYGTPMTVRYCIGFDLEAISDLEKTNPHTVFRKVIYEEQEQRKEILRVIGLAITIAKKHPSRVEEIGNLTADHLARLLPQLKSPAYAAEEEWRVIRWTRNDDVSDLCFDAARGVIRPYIEFKIEPLPIVELIILAPGRESAAVKAANMLLQKKTTTGNVKAEYSRIPFAE